MGIFDRVTRMEGLIEQLNFYEIHRVMTQLNWVWSIEGTLRVPTIPELKQTVMELMKEVDKENGYISTGGFIVQTSGNGKLSVAFAIEDEREPEDHWGYNHE